MGTEEQSYEVEDLEFEAYRERILIEKYLSGVIIDE